MFARYSCSKLVATATVSVVAVGSYYAMSSKIAPATVILNNSKPYSSRPLSLSNVQVTSLLRENEESYLVDRGRGVRRYDVSQFGSNSPCEDDRSEKIVQVPLIADSEEQISTDWMFWGIYDGHSGWTTSAKLRDQLIGRVISELDKTYEKPSPKAVSRLIPTPSAIDEAIKRGFLSLDDEIVKKSVDRLLNQQLSKAQSAELIAPALSGSCALLAFYDTFSRKLRVAVAGDSRAVLGSRTLDGSWTAKALSVDQTGSNHAEAQRIRKEHPGEESTAISRGRVLGALEPTRSFGDARYKWPREVQRRIASMFFGRSVNSNLQTPPYVTADPVITTTDIHPERGDFLVLGCDGVFELLSNAEIVSLVVEWMNEKMPSKENPKQKTGGLWSLLGKRDAPRSVMAVEDISTDKESQKPPFRRNNKQLQSTVEDDNVATHIIRNALGGADRDQVAMLAGIPSPMSRSYRDDLTVTVVFFGDDDDADVSTGKVRVNQAATAAGIKAKL